jgi:hypothetical protein
MSFYKYFILLACFSVSCSNTQKASDEKVYFDIRSFFESEARRLQLNSPHVEKTVTQNNQSEAQKVTIHDWKAELDLFIESDINKPSWKKSYSIHKNNNSIEYISNDGKLKTQRISIKKSHSGKVISILIKNQTKNSLYTTIEELSYFPDSAYIISKKQNVRLLGSNSFRVSGFFLK